MAFSLAAAFGLLAFVQLGSQMSDDYRDNEIRAEHHEILELADVKSELRRNKQEIPEQRAEGGENDVGQRLNRIPAITTPNK